jgi:intein-encoded DNA endonuclease-like protein
MKEITSPLEAYFYGWMLSDGSVYYNKQAYSYSTKIKVHQKDEDVLDLFLDFKVFKGKRIEGVNKYIISYNRQFALNLIELGCLPSKSKIINEGKVELPNINDELMPYFIRGLFDGDGCYYLRHKHSLNCTISNRNEVLLLQVKNYLDTKLDINCEFFFKKNKHRGVWCLRIRRNKEVKKYLDFVFNSDSDLSLICKRKYSKVKEYLDNYKTNKEIAIEACKTAKPRKPLSSETRIKIALAQKGRKVSLKTIEKIKQTRIDNSKFLIQIFDSKNNKIGEYKTLSEIKNASLKDNIFNLKPEELTNPNGRNGYPFYYLADNQINEAIKFNKAYKGLYFRKVQLKSGELMEKPEVVNHEPSLELNTL